MNTLFINSCIRKESRTLLLCREYIKRRLSPEKVTELTLKTEPLNPFTEQMLDKRDADISAKNFDSPAYRYAKDFAAADTVLIGAPFWDYSFPSLLKVYFEHICVNGITFGYAKNGDTLSLCKVKKLIYITTAGGYISEPNSLTLYLKELCAMFSIPELRLYKAEGLDIAGNDVNMILDTVINEFI